MIRKATIKDAETITEFNYLMAVETEDFNLNKSTLYNGVKALLNDENKGQYFLAEIDGIIVGQTLITYEWSDWRNGWMWWIQSVYVKKEYRRQGLFKALYTFIEGIAKEEQVLGLRLYVEKENRSAMKTYEQMGMSGDRYNMYEKFIKGDR